MMDNFVIALQSIICQHSKVFCSKVSVLLGLSLLLSPILEKVPSAVLFGVFLYMGQSGMNGVQLFDRTWLILKHVKYHPQVSYVRQVSRTAFKPI